MLKTPDCGQFSFFTAHRASPAAGITTTQDREVPGDQGEARFKFRQMQTGGTHELVTSGAAGRDRGDGARLDARHHQHRQRRMVVMLWANRCSTGRNRIRMRVRCNVRHRAPTGVAAERQRRSNTTNIIPDEKLKVMSVVGTRPEIIRLSRVLAALDEHCEHVLVYRPELRLRAQPGLLLTTCAQNHGVPDYF